ncbi:hypothetical protein HB662_14885 [Roseomonas frigidaquae]|uniref:Uncharacterized protein n=1 Tax=Falsiroseomonas frigidaquae TaxID=487318 RepID=A0ABX1F144_9PROT|nr:hypothetical protein [Falsiroseomonas frigidaquae]NKE46070.1 hypothetical protein [Falsiroseomonas frigidaquae]
MADMTDPALEIAELCEGLRGQNDKLMGDRALAAQFATAPWSVEFFEILFIVHRRMDQIVELVDGLGLNPSILAEAKAHVSTVKLAFSQDGLRNPWVHAKNSYLTPATVTPIKFLSPVLQPRYGYVRLTDAEIEELLGEVNLLIEWLSEHQLREQDFFRASIIEGLLVFRFRLERLRWLGWGYSLQALREVIAAYLALHGHVNLEAEPLTDAMLRKVAAYVGRVVKAAQFVKDTAETGQFMLQAYGAITLISQGKETIAGLLSYGGD